MRHNEHQKIISISAVLTRVCITFDKCSRDLGRIREAMGLDRKYQHVNWNWMILSR